MKVHCNMIAEMQPEQNHSTPIYFQKYKQLALEYQLYIVSYNLEEKPNTEH